MTDRAGQRLGNYHLIRLLGRGGFAEVYLGEHLRLGTHAAVKVLYTRLANSDDVISFEKEARTIAHLKHPRIVRVLDYDVEDDTPFLVMDYAPGGTLRKRHPKGTILPLTMIISYIKQIADALEYAHGQRVIHRDVKPENMLVGEHDELLLSDFGIAIVAQSSRYQSTQNMGGTMAYIAPEQIQGHPRTASDQYALGIVVYEWLSGNCPFHGSMTEIVAQHLAVPPPPLREKVPTISPDVERAILTALAKDPHKRFGNVRAFARALEQANQTALAHPVALPSEFTRQNQPLSPTPAGAEISPSQTSQPTDLVTSPSQALLPTNMITPLGQSPQPPIVVTPSYTTSLLPSSMRESVSSDEPRSSQHRISRRVVVVGMTALAVVGVAGSGLLWLARSQQPQVSLPSFRTTATPSSAHTPVGSTLLIYQGHSGAIYATPWSPDGTRIASGGYDKTIQVWDATNGSHIYTYRGHSNGIWTVAWSPDGKRIASGSDVIGGNSADRTVQVWNAVDGNNVYTYRGHSGSVRAVAWSPDGKRIASGSDDGTVQVWNSTTGSTFFTYTGHFSDPSVFKNGRSLYGYVLAVAWSPDGRLIASGAADQTVQVWSASSGSTLFTYRGHINWIHGVAWSPDSKRIASVAGDFGGVADHTVQVWDAVDRKSVYIYRGDPDLVYAVAWSPDGTRIASGGENQRVRVWQAV